MKYFLDDREVTDVTVCFEFGEGCYVTGGTFVNGGDLTDEECEALTDDYQAELYQSEYEKAVCGASDLAKDAHKYGGY